MHRAESTLLIIDDKLPHTALLQHSRLVAWALPVLTNRLAFAHRLCDATIWIWDVTRVLKESAAARGGRGFAKGFVIGVYGLHLGFTMAM